MLSVDHERRIREIERRAFVEGAATEMLALRGYPLSEEERGGVEAEAAKLYPEPEIEPGVAA